MAPSLKAASSNATNPLKASGASSPSFLNFVMFFMSYIAISLKGTRPGGRLARRLRNRRVSPALEARAAAAAGARSSDSQSFSLPDRRHPARLVPVGLRDDETAGLG